MSKTVILLLSVGFLVLFFGLAYLMTKDQKPDPNIQNYSKQQTDRPIAEAQSNFMDIGEMKVSETKEVSFTLKNSGNKPLQILNINSSCNCTFGKIIYKDLETKQFGMHKQSGYVTDIAPGDIATVKVIYTPAIMPVYGPVSRDVIVTTNDPNNLKIIFTLKTTVK
ncbi:hypothetical protein A2130_04615 [Candidatus Woesebacteria bacterium GWC2_33_12]|uniref:PF07610 family protein n=1 Tax=Candidatus Woesebacteria bacterium GW2011_GWB1_33_22 TaxID=1618566 RepID=A0A0G0CNW0_9BACT|nr:MAG: hypothetical protein UR29_C0005G0020 [Candidatus Woesebacteria bacterium GW2011_GWC2_33_12]KKP42326.1 MAG: hypothetical protein UR33_C0003G0019 [Candidatus Woesebacteria bacterium GW2011_GWA2_33_20]KKP45077.1 MAG: hypothetical protein UR35_C0003G0019 [Candidatus Woesebacteria bacterium GW2011_GWB1_33_22]KKP46953.1 MAG: hypothetical protein UR37_C0003G0019 [Microgenomates group bacterium GW2011_GWC1_33_28]KKP50779.1 MAG: hypothetical protein UR41_C0003G0019 [Candidatus Woesebacteria bact